MSDLKLRPERPSREGKILSLAQVRLMYPNLCRGAVFRYNFHEEFEAPGEPSKNDRPVVIMDTNPLERVAQNKSLHVVPLSRNKKEKCDNGIIIQLNREAVTAIYSQATTINSRKLGSFVGITWLTDTKKISDRLQDHISVGAEKGPNRLRPGNIFLVEWHNRENMRPVVIVSTGHIEGDRIRSIPIQVLPINRAILSEKGEQPFDTALAVAPSRLLKGVSSGVASLDMLQRAQMLIRKNFGLTISI